jgi:hypothetical protein
VKIANIASFLKKPYDHRMMEVDSVCLMKLIVMTETARESGALLEAIEDGVNSFIKGNALKKALRTSMTTASSRISSESEQELELCGFTISSCVHRGRAPIATHFVDVAVRRSLDHRADKILTGYTPRSRYH